MSKVMAIILLVFVNYAHFSNKYIEIMQRQEPTKMLVKNIYISDGKISLASFVQVMLLLFTLNLVK